MSIKANASTNDPAVARMQDLASSEPPLTRPLVVLDTNAVLDWLVFGDPSMAALAAAVQNGQLRWAASGPMREEFDLVVGRDWARERGADPAGLDAAWSAHATPHAPAARAAGLTCSDPADQKFLDLAVACSARWLVSRDKALLRLARRAAPLGLLIVRPADWRPQ